MVIVKKKTSWIKVGKIRPIIWKSNQGNQGSSVNQKNVIQGQRPDRENRHTQQRT